MTHEISDRLTPIPEAEYIEVALKAWKRFYGKLPKVPQLACCLAQMVLETGREPDPDRPGKYLWGWLAHNFNWGNIKSRPGDGSHWQYYSCGEEVSLEEAHKLMAESPGQVTIKKTYSWPNGSKRASIWLEAPHPWTRFRAYETALEGLVDYIDFLVKERDRYLTAWNEGVLKGDPERFSRELGKAGYYTADVDRYTKTVVSLFNEFQPKIKEALESEEGERLLAQERAWERSRILSLVSLTLDSYDDKLDENEARQSQTSNVPTV